MYSPLRFLPSVLRKSRPIHLTFFVTRRCNARCPFCFYLEGENEARGGENLSLEEIERFSGSLGSLLWLAFSGGEIFLREDLTEISGIFYRENRPSIMLYPTNGLMPERIEETTVRILESCPRSVVAVKLSIDGLGEAHDALRGVPGSFDKVLETYRRLGPLLKRYLNFELGVNTVFCSENQDQMDDIVEFVKGLDMIRTHTVSLVRGDIRDKGFKHVDIDKYLKTIENIERNLKDGSTPTYSFAGARVKAAQDILQRRLIHRTVRDRKRQLPCYAGRLNVVLTETGDVFPCESFAEKWRLGNIRDYSYDITRLLESPPAESIVSGIKDTCFCTHECYLMTNILFNPAMYPGLLKEAVRIG